MNLPGKGFKKKKIVSLCLCDVHLKPQVSMSGEKKEQNGAMLSVEDPMKQQQHDGPSPSAAL
jgi:hypothetical protein